MVGKTVKSDLNETIAEFLENDYNEQDKSKKLLITLNDSNEKLTMLQSAVNNTTQRKNTATPGVFQIIKDYSDDQFSENFQVTDPILRGEKVDYCVSMVTKDSNNQAKTVQIRRRYSDFFNLR